MQNKELLIKALVELTNKCIVSIGQVYDFAAILKAIIINGFGLFVLLALHLVF